MKTLTLIVSAFVILSFVLTGCGKKDTKVSDKDKYENTTKDTAQKNSEKLLTTADKAGKYFCTMHPEQQSDDSAARCSICKMKLTSKDDWDEKMDKKHDELVEKYKGKNNLEHFEVELSKIKSDECEKYIKDALKKDAGVVDYFIDILDPRIHVMYDKNKTNKTEIEKYIADAGFDANKTKANQDVKNKIPEDCR